MSDIRPIASDLDGTWDLHPEIHGEVDFIITGNTWTEFNHVKSLVKESIPVYYNPGKQELMDIVMHKAHIINKTNVEKYYEDQDTQVDLLKALCPRARIILVKDYETAI